MKVISILQPWATLASLGLKQIETRSWDTRYRGEFLIHASAKQISKKDMDFYRNTSPEFKFAEDAGFLSYSKLEYGKIVGGAKIIDSVPIERALQIIGDNVSKGDMTANQGMREMAYGDYSPNRFGWVLQDCFDLMISVRAKGQLGWWDTNGKSAFSLSATPEMDGIYKLFYFGKHIGNCSKGYFNSFIHSGCDTSMLRIIPGTIKLHEQSMFGERNRIHNKIGNLYTI